MGGTLLSAGTNKRMIELDTTIDVSGVTAKQIYDFMMECNDERYQKW